jgi:hypothetical protein
MKDTSLETAYSAAMQEMETSKLSWAIMEDHMQTHTFSSLRVLPYQAHGGLPTSALKRFVGDSWMFKENINPSALWTVLLELTNGRTKARKWWEDCEVNESLGQLWAWLKQLVVKLIHKKDGTSPSLPILQTSTESMDTEPGYTGFEIISSHLGLRAWAMSMGMVDCTDWTAEALDDNPTKSPGFSPWFAKRTRRGAEEDPLGHSVEQQHLVILAAMTRARKGHS